jgi:hypothetical protein
MYFGGKNQYILAGKILDFLAGKALEFWREKTLNMITEHVDFHIFPLKRTVVH